MASSRVTYRGSIAPSGAAETLFKVLEDKRATESYKERSAIDAARMKEAAEQRFGFDKYLAQMRQDYETVQYEREKTKEEQKNVATQKGLYGLMGGMAQEGTVGMEPFGEYEPASGTFMPKPFEPQAAPLMKDVLMAHVQEGIKSRYAGQQERQKEAFAEMQRRFGLATESDMSVLNAKVAWLEQHDTQSPFLATLRGMQAAYQQQGGIEKKTIFAAVTQADTHIAKQSAALENIMKRAELAKDTAVEIQKMKDEIERHKANMKLQGDIGKQSYKQTKDLSLAAKRRFDAVSREYNDYSVAISAGVYSGAALLAVQQHVKSLSQQMEEARQRMMEADNALAEGAAYQIQQDSAEVQSMAARSRMLMLPKYEYAKGNYDRLKPEDRDEVNKALGTSAPPPEGRGGTAPGPTISPSTGGALPGQSGTGLEAGKAATAVSGEIDRRAQEIYNRTAEINERRRREASSKKKVEPRPESLTMPQNPWAGFKGELYDLMSPRAKGKSLPQKEAEEAAVPSPPPEGAEAPFGYEVPQPLTDNHRQELMDLAKEGQRALGLGAIPPRPGSVAYNALRRWITNEYYRRYEKKK